MKNIQETLTKIWNDDNQSDFSNPLCSFLYTLSLSYVAAVRLRNELYEAGLLKAKKLPCPVVSIGNLTVGGTGKTPMVIMLTNFLRKKGRRPAVLSRGYAGKGSSPVTVVSDGNRILAGPGEAGDEPFLIAASAGGTPVLTGRDRYAAGWHALDKLGADVLVLDDAFQHRQVFRDLNILLLDAERPFGNGCMLPRGSLREPESALGRADIIVLTRADEKTPSAFQQELHRRFPGMPVFQARHRPKGIIPLSTLRPNMSFPPPIKDFEGRRRRESTEEKTWIPDQVRNDNSLLQEDNSYNLDSLNGKRVYAFAGIARPESFRSTIKSLGGELTAFKAYPDHHPYTAEDVRNILKAAREHGAEIILTTEKDGVKLAGLGDAVRDICVLRIEMEILYEGKRFEDTVLAGLSA